MKATRLFFLLALAMAIILPQELDAQLNPGRILRNTKKKAERKVEERVEKRIDKAVDKTLDKAEDAIDGKGQGAESETEQAEGASELAPDVTHPTLNWSKFDFVPGDVIIFEDNLDGERNGEFPSRWDLVSGSVENAVFGGENVIMFINSNTNSYGGIVPLLKNSSEDYLPNEFTIEFDAYFDQPNRTYRVLFYDGNNQGNLNRSVNRGSNSDTDRVRISQNSAVFGSTNGYYPGFTSNTSENASLSQAGWRRISISFNKRALKLYIDDARVLNIPNLSYNPLGITLAYHNPNGGHQGYMKNIRIAQGAVPLYDKFLTDGKIVASGIRFDVNRATIRPESMGVINEIVQLMNQHHELKFNVEGHTDSDGNPTNNQTLSEARAKAVLDKMVEMGISQDRLASKGHGQSQPLAPNNTPEGKAQNRRVEFVKM